MTRTRFTIARLMVIVLLLALGLAALRNTARKMPRSPLWRGALPSGNKCSPGERETLTGIVAARRGPAGWAATAVRASWRLRDRRRSCTAGGRRQYHERVRVHALR